MFGKDENWYWSSSSYTGDSSHAWDVDFATGPVGIDDKGDGRHVRCVRRGPP